MQKSSVTSHLTQVFLGVGVRLDVSLQLHVVFVGLGTQLTCIRPVYNTLQSMM